MPKLTVPHPAQDIRSVTVAKFSARTALQRASSPSQPPAPPAPARPPSRPASPWSESSVGRSLATSSANASEPPKTQIRTGGRVLEPHRPPRGRGTRGWPGRGASASPSMPSSQYRRPFPLSSKNASLPGSWPTSPTTSTSTPSRRHRTYPRAVKRARHNSCRVKRPGDYGTRHPGPATSVNGRRFTRLTRNIINRNDQLRLSGIGP
jgi:hypothetical protein